MTLAARTKLAARDRLVLDHIGLMKNIAVALARELPARMELDDLIGEGYIGLLQAADRYLPGGKVQFSAYAKPRIRGAMVDSIRRRHWTAANFLRLDEETIPAQRVMPAARRRRYEIRILPVQA